MAALLDSIPTIRRIDGQRPAPRLVVGDDTWRTLVGDIADGRWTMASLWGDAGAVHMAVLDEATGEIAIVTYECAAGRFPSVAVEHPPAIRLERAIHDLYGLEPVGASDRRRWLDFGFWEVGHPLAAHPGPARAAEPYAFLPVEGESLHQIPVGPVHAGIIEPGHFRFTANGEAVVRLEQRLGWVHKGIDGLMRGADLGRAARLAARTSGDSTVTYGIAFARAVETALGVAPPSRAVDLRAVMAELERIANHLGDVGAICNDASFALMHAHCGILREEVLRACAACFGHRLMMDKVVPGGVATDLDAAGVARLRTLIATVRTRFPELVELYDNTASLQDRTVTTGVVAPELVRRFGAGGHVGRASGRRFDCRKTPGYAPYDGLAFDVPVFESGDVNARVWVRIREIEQSLGLIDQLVARLPHGPVQVAIEPVGAGERESFALAEAFRGDVLAWVRIDADGRIARCHLRDASWFQWPLLEAAIEGNIVADFPLCNKSFNCSYSGHDL